MLPQNWPEMWFIWVSPLCVRSATLGAISEQKIYNNLSGSMNQQYLLYANKQIIFGILSFVRLNCKIRVANLVYCWWLYDCGVFGFYYAGFQGLYNFACIFTVIGCAKLLLHNRAQTDPKRYVVGFIVGTMPKKIHNSIS